MNSNSFQIDTVSVRLVKDVPLLSDKPLTCQRDIYELLGDYMSQFDKEVIFVLNLNAQNQVINGSLVSLGTLEYAVFHPRELFKSSILSNASSIVMIHNHPSGNVLPSRNDIAITDNLVKACDIMGIKLLDHIIVGSNNGTYFSFRDKALINDNTVYFTQELADLNFGKRGGR